MAAQLARHEHPRGLGKQCVACQAFTSQGKPWCPEHVMLSPYARVVRATLDKIELKTITQEFVLEVDLATRDALTQRVSVSAGLIARAVQTGDELVPPAKVARAWAALGYRVVTGARGVARVGRES